jgi:hypothetical protein
VTEHIQYLVETGRRMPSYTLIAAVITLGLTVPALADTSQCDNSPKQYQAAFNRGDAKGVAAVFSPDGVYVTPFGPVTGAHIEEHANLLIAKMGLKNLVIDVTKCAMTSGPARWYYGSWKSDSLQGPTGGFWTAIEETSGKVANLTYSLTPPPPNASK